MNSLAQLKAAIARNPEDPALYYDLGGIYFSAHQLDTAISTYQTALKLAPDHPQILLQLGNCHSAAGHYLEAEKHFSACLKADANDVAAHFNLANVLRELGRTQEAASSYRAALRLEPNDADIHNNLGNVLRELGQLDAAIGCYQTALNINPHLYHAKVHMVHQKQHICDWQDLARDVEEIKSWVTNNPEAQVSPFAFLAMPNTRADLQLNCASNWVKSRYTTLLMQKEVLHFTHTEKQKNKIKIGYLSADFRLHPLAFLITELIERHDRKHFEIIAYAYGPDDDSETKKRLVKAFDAFCDIRALSDIEAAKKIYADEIDILVDLTGFTQTSRTGIVALRPAKQHVSWLGFAGTMGYLPDNTTDSKQALFDYLLTDRFISPPESAENYAEKLAYLPCYQPNDSKRPIGKIPARAACNLPENQFVFCCFNQSFKFTPAMFSGWMRILQRCPNSVLWLLDCNRWAKENLFQVASQYNVDKNRIIFAPRVDIATHLARHAHADLFLDTLPYNAHTTCSDALWMDVPVLTLVGDTFSARVAGSLCLSLDLTELMTNSLQDYENKAFFYYQHPQELLKLKQKIQNNKSTSVLFNSEVFARHLEQTYCDMLAIKKPNQD